MSEIENVLGYKFKNEKIIDLALTHKSYSKENYERLEFLGDAVLELIITEKLYTHNPLKEGKLSTVRSNIVSGKNLTIVFEKIGLEKFIHFGGSLKSISSSIKEDIIEAIIGAIYIDGGLNQAKKFVNHFIISDISSIEPVYDFKTQLQEFLQSKGMVKIEYFDAKKVKSDFGKFAIDLLVNGKVVAHASGHSKKTAEQLCAKEALAKLIEK